VLIIEVHNEIKSKSKNEFEGGQRDLRRCRGRWSWRSCSWQQLFSATPWPSDVRSEWTDKPGMIEFLQRNPGLPTPACMQFLNSSQVSLFIRLYGRHYVLLLSYISSFSSPPNLQGRLADRHQTLPHGDPDLWNSVRNLGTPFRSKFGGPKHEISARFRTTSRLEPDSGTQQDILNRKTALQTTDTYTSAQANLIWYTLIHKRLK